MVSTSAQDASKPQAPPDSRAGLVFVAVLTATLKRRVDETLEPIKPSVGNALGHLVSRVATDVTESTSIRSCLVLAPHPDDETLGCGVTMMRRVEGGASVRVVVATDGGKWPPEGDPVHNAAVRRAELREATQLLGLADAAVTQLGFPDNGLVDAGESLVDAIADAVRSARPADVLVTSEHDPHRDHAALGLAARHALSGTDTRLLVYPVWQWLRPGAWIRTLRSSGRPEAVRTEGFLSRKRAAIGVYRSQVAPLSSDRWDEGLPSMFLRHFFGANEIFLPVSVDGSPKVTSRDGTGR
jgi:LmbE family N-acetylglucosaminyl deacetylase